MSVRETIQFFYDFDVPRYLEILRGEYKAEEHPNQPGSYLVYGCPFYEPKWLEDHVSILGFNKVPLSDLLIQAIAYHPELVPDEVVILWLIEQEVFLEVTVGELRKRHETR